MLQEASGPECGETLLFSGPVCQANKDDRSEFLYQFYLVKEERLKAWYLGGLTDSLGMQG